MLGPGNLKHCNDQFIEAHDEADVVSDFYQEMTKAVLRHHVRLENPTVAELDECFNHFINLAPLKPTEAVFVYYVGHGVEHNNSMHAVLLNQ